MLPGYPPRPLQLRPSSVITYLYGPDTYGALQAIQNQAQKLKARLVYVDQEEAIAKSVREVLLSGQTLFGANLHVLRDPSLWPVALQNDIALLVKQTPQTSAIIWDRIKTDKRTTLWQAVKPYAKEFPLLSIPQLTAWLQQEATSRSCSIETKACEMLVARIGFDRWQLINTLEQLSLRLATMTVADVQNTVPDPGLIANSFDLVDTIMAGQAPRALAVLESLLEAGEEEVALLGLLAWQYRTIFFIQLDVKAGRSLSDIARRRKMNPFVVEKGVALARRFPPAFLLDALSRIMATDFAAKQGRVESFRTALVMLVLGLLEQQKSMV